MRLSLASSLGGRTLRVAAAALVAAANLVAVACSGSSSSPTESGGPVSAEQVEASSVAMINSERGGAGLGQLWFDPVLSEVARQYSREMRDQGFVSHYDQHGVAVDGRLRSAGVRFVKAGENIAAVETADPAGDAHRGFMASAPHRANILAGDYTSVGVGVASVGDKFWITEIFIRE